MCAWSADIRNSSDLKENSNKTAINLGIPEISWESGAGGGGGRMEVVLQKKKITLLLSTDMPLFICWSTSWHADWRCNFKDTCSSRDISGELVQDVGKWSCCQHTHCFTWWNHCSFVACYASAKALRGKHCFLHWQGAWSMYVQPPPQGQKKGFCSEAAFTSPVVEFCIMLLSSLWASFGFQSSTDSTPRLSVCLCPRLPNWSCFSYYFPNQLNWSEFAPVFNLL